MRNRGDTNPARNTAIAMMKAPAIISSPRWCSRSACPKPLAAAPRATNTAVNPATNRSVDTTMRRTLPWSPACSSATLIPDTMER